MRTIGKKWRNFIKNETIKAIEERKQRKYINNIRMYSNIENEIIDKLPSKLWDTWEGADGEIKTIIEETILNY